jgi:gliding motility-associated-like protein
MKEAILPYMKQIIFSLFAILFFFGCSKKEAQVTYKLSEDLCLICDSTPYKVIGNDTIQIGNIITPNDDGFNDFFSIHKYHTYSNKDSINLTIFDRDNKQIVHYQYYLNDWPKYVPSQHQQDLTGLSNGLYRYRLSSLSGSLDGLFIIIFKKDDYLDKHASDADCFNCAKYFDDADPAMVILD